MINSSGFDRTFINTRYNKERFEQKPEFPQILSTISPLNVMVTPELD